MKNRSAEKHDGQMPDVSERLDGQLPQFSPHEDAVVEAVYRDFIANELPVAEIAAKHSVGRSTIYDWARRLEWKKDRTTIARRRFKRTRAKFEEELRTRESIDDSDIQVNQDGRRYFDVPVVGPGNQPWTEPFGVMPGNSRRVSEVRDERTGALSLRCYLPDHNNVAMVDHRANLDDVESLVPQPESAEDDF
jgi:hypothetical protein